MITVHSICEIIEDFAPLSLQESYDNAGLLVGNLHKELSGVLVCIDVTDAVIDEAIRHNCNLIVSHHPLIFSGLKRLVGQDDVQRLVEKAIKNDIAVYAAHTNIDNVYQGVNGRIAQKLQLIHTRILQPKSNSLLKLICYVPNVHANIVRKALFDSGAGKIGNYEDCSFNSEGTGTFNGNEKANPFVGMKGQMHAEPETRIEVLVPNHLKNKVVRALLATHPYEEPAFDLVPILNPNPAIGGGLIGELSTEIDELDFLNSIKERFNLSVIRHTPLLGKKIKSVALCGGSGSFLIQAAMTAKADIYISGDLKYHDFFLAEKQIVLADIGHFESEQFTKEIFYEIITKKIPTFAVRISDINTNPINYL